MIEELIAYYRENASDEALIYKHMNPSLKRIDRFIFWLFLIASVVLIIGLFLIFFQVFSIKFWVIVQFFLVMILLFISAKIQARSINEILKNNHNIVQDVSMAWRTKKYKDKQLAVLIGYLKRNKLYEKQKIEQLINRIKTNGLIKLPPLVLPSLIVSFVAPIWNYTIPHIYNLFVTKESGAKEAIVKENIGGVLGVSIGLTFVVVIVLFSIGSINRSLFKLKNELIPDLLRTEGYYKSQLIELLQDVSLKL